jgi:hypothetical protein
VLSINSNNSVRVTTPFGGFKQSGYGRELGPHARTPTPRSSRSSSQPHEPPRGEGLRDHRRPRRHRRATAELFAREGARVVGVDVLEGSPGELALRSTSPTSSR